MVIFYSYVNVYQRVIRICSVGCTWIYHTMFCWLKLIEPVLTYVYIKTNHVSCQIPWFVGVAQHLLLILGQKKPKKNPGFLHPPTIKPAVWVLDHIIHPCLRSSQWELGSNNKGIVTSSIPPVLGKYRKMSVLRLLQFSTFCRWNVHLCCSNPANFTSLNPYFLLKSHPLFLLHPIFVQIFGRTAQKKETGHPAGFSASPCVTLRILTSRGPVNSGTAGFSGEANGWREFFIWDYLITIDFI